ncbi:hypothetical protein [Streptomyces sp. NPDC093970]|uniref:hypothetical protein n=1 Tax=Streptomyces sp. NPDC093970 TaxID=3155076 RepID=UPI003445C7C1
MNNHEHPHAGWAGRQQPYGQPPVQPQPPGRGPGAGKVVGLGCLGLLGVAVVIGVAAAVVGDHGSDGSGGAAPKATSTSAATTATAAGHGTSAGAQDDDRKAAAPKTVVFKVWGTAPAGVLGGLDINYGSDSDTRKGEFRNGRFEATLPFTKGALYYTLNAQLQGSGDIDCSVTVDGTTKSGHASGGYNICDTQLTSDFTGGWR